jgi:hypothetical protein
LLTRDEARRIASKHRHAAGATTRNEKLSPKDRRSGLFLNKASAPLPSWSISRSCRSCCCAERNAGRFDVCYWGNAMSVLPPKADIVERDRHVRFVPRRRHYAPARTSILHPYNREGLCIGIGGARIHRRLTAMHLVRNGTLRYLHDPVSDGSNERDLVSLVLRFTLVELRQEILQVTHFFDAVLEPSLAFSVGK